MVVLSHAGCSDFTFIFHSSGRTIYISSFYLIVNVEKMAAIVGRTCRRGSCEWSMPAYFAEDFITNNTVVKNVTLIISHP